MKTITFDRGDDIDIVFNLKEKCNKEPLDLTEVTEIKIAVKACEGCDRRDNL